jgi:hypothetical protein
MPGIDINSKVMQRGTGSEDSFDKIIREHR